MPKMYVYYKQDFWLVKKMHLNEYSFPIRYFCFVTLHAVCLVNYTLAWCNYKDEYYAFLHRRNNREQ